MLHTLRLSLLLAFGVASASAQSAPRLPASFYDIELRSSLLDGAVSRIGAGGANRPQAGRLPPSGVGGGINVPENSGAGRFIIARDSLLFRNGPDVVEIATADFIAVDDVHTEGAPHLVWIRLRYRHPDGERELFVRRYTTREQSALRAALEAAMTRQP